MLFIYHVRQFEVRGYDTYSDMVVVARDMDEARRMNPHGEMADGQGTWKWHRSSWASHPRLVQVVCLGGALDNIRVGVVCASFHAG